MKVEILLKTVLVLLLVLLAVVITSWMTSERMAARAQGGGGSGSGDWLMVASELRSGEGLVYLLNTKKETLLVYSYHRGRRSRTTGRNRFDGDFQFLAGRHCKWDLLYSQLLPFPKEKPKSDMLTPAQLKMLFEKASRQPG